MNIIKYIDLVETFENEDDELYDEVVRENFTLPIIIEEQKIDYICPFFSSSGKIFNNVSVMKYENELIKVVGNYKLLNELKRKGHTPIGFINGKQRQENIENRTKIKSSTKRRTKGSSK